VREHRLRTVPPARFFEEIARDTGRACYGARDTLFALDLGAAGNGDGTGGDNDGDGDETTLVEWLANRHERFGAALELVTDRSPEGSRFCRGLGALLRYRVDFSVDDAESDPSDDDAP